MPKIVLKEWVDLEAMRRDARRAEYTAAARGREVDRRRRRVARLEAAKPGIDAALDATRTAKDEALFRSHSFTVRRDFVRLNPPRTVPDPDDDTPYRENVADRPPAGQLVNRRNRALAFYLLAIWEAQASTMPNAVYRRRRPRIHYGRGFDTLIGDRPLAKRQRNNRSQRILTMLQDCRLVGMKADGTSGRYNDFELLMEDRSGDPYAAPDPGERLSLPSAFITNGWYLVLEPTEIACLLMLIDLAQEHPLEHRDTGIGAIDRVRRAVYGITPEVYATHNELDEFGLVRTTDSVAARRRGRVDPAALGDADLVAYQFQVVLDALDRDAYDVVHEALVDPLGGRLVDDPAKIL